VAVEAAGEVPKAAAPRVANADVTPMRVEAIQRGTTAIAKQVVERILYVFRYRVVPERPGDLVIPPVHVRLGTRAGATEPVRLAIRKLPPEGRPASFLGGVGRLEVGAEAWPPSVRVGQTLEYRVQLLGPGARGSTRAPDVRGLARLPLGLEVEPLPPEVVDDPPSRVFRYRLRPTKPGEAVLPPVSVATFDPKAGHYLTRAARGVSIEVVDVPQFDPKTLQYAPPPAPAGNPVTSLAEPRHWLKWLVGLAACVVGLMACFLGVRALAQARATRAADPVWFARQSVRRLAQPFDGEEALAAWVAEAIAHYLQLAAGRPPGALTPVEARNAFDTLTGMPAIAKYAGEVMSKCDRSRFSGREGALEELRTETRRLFQMLEQFPARSAAAALR
jgi:hypothetical protein